jgi:dihydroneopterin aldolase
VTNPDEAELAVAGGADLIDLKDPVQGAFGALPVEVVEASVRLVAGRRPVSAVLGDHITEPAALFDAASRLAETGIDFLKIGFKPPEVHPGETRLACIEVLQPLAKKVGLIGAFFADLEEVDATTLSLLSRAGFKGAMLDTADKSAGRLMTRLGIAALSRFVEGCRDASLMSGLAGSLETPDIPRLLSLTPGFLGFRGALCRASQRTDALDPDALKIVRDLIPRQAGSSDLGGGPKIDWRLLTGRGYAAPADKGTDTDRVFVHDLVMPVAIGAYDFERGHNQRVRFNIDVDVRRVVGQPEDMRDIFSYDLVIDGIKLILSRGHVDLVETLAEQIATAMLGHAQVVAIKVRVEKLDVIDGCVGIEIQRERSAAVGRMGQLYAGYADRTGLKSGF